MTKRSRIPVVMLAVALSTALGGCAKETVCASDQVVCGDACATVATDPANCGACGRACGERQTCTAGECVWGSVQDCGAPGRTCGAGERCVSGDCVGDLYVACFATAELREATASLAPAGVPLATAQGPIATTWLGDTLYVAGSIGNAVDAFRFDPPSPRKVATLTIPAASVGYADLESVAAANGLLFVSNAAANVLDVLDPAAARVVDEIPLGAGAYPQGIVVSGTKAYVALNGLDQIAVVDVSASGSCASPPCGSVSTRIALPAALASPGGRPMPSRLALSGGKLYATLWNLDATTWAPAGDGRLAVVDTATDALVTAEAIDLGPDCRNPADLAVSGGVLYVTCGFFPYDAPGDITGAAIVPVDVSSATPAVRPALALTDHAPGAIAFCGGVGYAGDRASGAVLRYDPATNAVSSIETLCPAPASGPGPLVAAVTCGP